MSHQGMCRAVGFSASRSTFSPYCFPRAGIFPMEEKRCGWYNPAYRYTHRPSKSPSCLHSLVLTVLGLCVLPNPRFNYVSSFVAPVEYHGKTRNAINWGWHSFSAKLFTAVPCNSLQKLLLLRMLKFKNLVNTKIDRKITLWLVERWKFANILEMA